MKVGKFVLVPVNFGGTMIESPVCFVDDYGYKIQLCTRSNTVLQALTFKVFVSFADYQSSLQSMKRFKNARILSYATYEAFDMIFSENVLCYIGYVQKCFTRDH